jgi:hypothetical protein
VLQVIRDNYLPHEARGNTLAFEWGRRAAHDLPRLLLLIQQLAGTQGAARVLKRGGGGGGAGGGGGGAGGGGVEITTDLVNGGTLESLVTDRVERLTCFQDLPYALRYSSLSHTHTLSIYRHI